jgi:molybdopterin-binding protein
MIEIRGLAARLGEFELRDVSFDVPDRGYGVVIGPAGSGKTTLLEAIAGVVPSRGGEVRLNGESVTTRPPDERGVGLVYQHGYLFPHLSMVENLRYGARDEATVDELVRRLEIAPLRERDVRSLSGGERQLVSLARTLARRPSVLLLDEPFSALDPRRRGKTRREVRALHREWGFTALQVTHDFTEAGLLGDVAVLLDGGRVLQYGPPEQVFRRPASPYIAEFLGAENVFAGTARVLADKAPDWLDADPGSLSEGFHAIEFTSGPLTLYTVGNSPEGPCYAVVRSEEITLSLEAQSTSARNLFKGRVTEVGTLGAFARVTLDVEGVPLVAAVTTRSVQEMNLKEGDAVYATFKALGVHLC